MAPDGGIGVGDLMRYRSDAIDRYLHLRELARTGHVVHVSRGPWQRHRGAVTVSDRLTGRLVSHSRARVCT